MEEQAGIYRITFYEAKDLLFTYVDKYTVNNVSTTGEIIELENSDENGTDLSLNFSHLRSENNKLHYKNVINWTQYGLTDDNLELIEKLKCSIYGWIPVIEFYNTTKKIITTPLKYSESSIKNNVSNSYSILLDNTQYSTRMLEFAQAIWILSTGIWDDSGIWIDSETWKDN